MLVFHIVNVHISHHSFHVISSNFHSTGLFRTGIVDDWSIKDSGGPALILISFLTPHVTISVAGLESLQVKPFERRAMEEMRECASRRTMGQFVRSEEKAEKQSDRGRVKPPRV